LLLILLIGYFYFKTRNLNFDEIFGSFYQTNVIYTYLGIAFLLVFINYGLEIIKWQILVKPTESRTFGQASKDVLLGTAAGVLTPFMLGDFAGRVSSFSKNNISKVLVLNAFNSFTQTWAAMAFACVSLIFMSLTHPSASLPFIYISIFALICSLSLYLLLNSKIKQKMGAILPKTWQKTLLIQIDLNIKLKVVLFTLLRNLTYFFQYLLLFKAFQIQLNSEIIFIGVNLVLFAKTFGFGLNALSDLGLRSILSLQFFENYGVASIYILCITSFIWFINVIIPAIIGAIIPIFNKKKWS
jgi:hypothetical protein